MKFSIALVMLISGTIFAQSISLSRNGQTYPARYVGNGMYAVSLQDTTYLIIPQAIVDSLLQKIELLQAENERHRRVLAAQDSLLNAYRSFEQRARQHIAVQQQLIATADSLYLGYQQLYRKARSLIGYGKYALWGQITVARWGSPATTYPLGSLGIGFENWMIGYQFGQQFQGISVGIRWPVGW